MKYSIKRKDIEGKIGRWGIGNIKGKEKCNDKNNILPLRFHSGAKGKQ